MKYLLGQHEGQWACYCFHVFLETIGTTTQRLLGYRYFCSASQLNSLLLHGRKGYKSNACFKEVNLHNCSQKRGKQSRAWTVLITYPYLYQDIRDTLHIKRMTPLSFHFCVSELSPSITYQRHSLLLEVIWLSPFTDCINCGPMFRKQHA